MEDLAPGASLEAISASLDLPNIKVPEGAEVASAQDSLRLDFIPIADLYVDRRYQRRTSANSRMRIRSMVAEFSWSKFGAIAVTEETDGRFSIIDGQHRAIAAAAIRASHVPAVIATGDVAAQAETFVGINAMRTSVASIDKFRARVAAADPVAVAVHKMLTELDISTDVPAGAGIRHRETRAVSTLEKLQKRHGQGVLFTALETLLNAQPGQNNLLTSFAIEVTATVLAKMLDAGRDLERLDRTLAEIDFETLKEEATQLRKLTGGQASAKGADLLLQRVNKGLKDRIT
ncbi:MAG: ParB N-terminal domain-containing protein [Rhodobacteraceae bacterium]|nr:ParB N-terminal domain-containing protein [Paracoccaceae bacterium]MBR9823703.1 ParB N-terminal domain-containing protein [Paracoccaceae bacterium]